MNVKVDEKLLTMSSGEHLYRTIKGLEREGAKVSLGHRAWARCYEKYGEYFWTRKDVDEILKQAENELRQEK